MATVKVANPARSGFRLPDQTNKRPDEKMTTNRELSWTGSEHHLSRHFGNPETIIVRSEMGLSRYRGDPRPLYPDLMIVLDADVALFERQNGYVIADQRKPPDFVLEVASESTGRRDVTDKMRDYERLLVPEYWTFDRTGRYHGMRLGGRLIVNRRYLYLPIQTIEEDVLEGASPRLNLNLRWDHGDLRWFDRRTGLHIVTFGHLEDRVEVLETELDSERAARAAAMRRAEMAERERDSERAARETAQRQVADLQAELERYRRMR